MMRRAVPSKGLPGPETADTEYHPSNEVQMRSVGLFSVAAALSLVGCNQQAEKDLAECRIELTRSQADVSAAKAYQTAAEQKATAIEGQLTQVQTQLAEFQK